jgi:hypothetical protein
MKWQLLKVMFPVNGQAQPSIPTGRQAAVIDILPSTLVQTVQWRVACAVTGVSNSAALNSVAPKLPNKSIFFFTLNSLFLPVRMGRDRGRCYTYR